MGHPLLSGWVKHIALSSACFDCALYCGVLLDKVPGALSTKYYAQIDWKCRTLKASSLTFGALHALGHLGALWEAETNSRCETCSRGGDVLLCSWCNLVYHNTEACLGGSVLQSPALDSEKFEWACPKCFKAAVREITKPRRRAPPQPARKRSRTT